ncbi:MAG: phosphatase PAP2 family protein [Actinomycetota bacterium]|nr:phosphatase PAP2 family protein [Actinomycetota bacterium]
MSGRAPEPDAPPAGDPETEPDDPPASGAGAPAEARPPGLRWWREVLYVLGFYALYSLIRNTQGSASVSEAHAFANARHLISVERAVGVYHERSVQHAFLGWRPFIEFWNVFYGTFHFVVTVVALILLFRRFPARYPPWRNTLAATTALALVGFAAYPLMPPRLLPASFGFVDTLRVFGSLWSFESGPVARVSNQYAAMPSLHFAWSSWSALVLFPLMRRPWSKALVALYPASTLFAIVVTANHYVLDAAGGAAALAMGATVGFALAGLTVRRRTGPADRHPGDEPVPNRA